MKSPPRPSTLESRFLPLLFHGSSVPPFLETCFHPPMYLFQTPLPDGRWMIIFLQQPTRDKNIVFDLLLDLRLDFSDGAMEKWMRPWSGGFLAQQLFQPPLNCICCFFSQFGLLDLGKEISLRSVGENPSCSSFFILQYLTKSLSSWVLFIWPPAGSYRRGTPPFLNNFLLLVE